MDKCSKCGSEDVYQRAGRGPGQLTCRECRRRRQRETASRWRTSQAAADVAEARRETRLVHSSSRLVEAESLFLREFKAAATEHLRGTVVPRGLGTRRPPPAKKLSRSVLLLCSDWHLGADLSVRNDPREFREVQEARRLEYILRQALDYKPQYRASSRFHLLLNGDLIHGQLGHDLRDGAPLTEQMVVFWRAARSMVAELSRAWPKVDVWCQPGNHGRDTSRHPRRATRDKWDGNEWRLYWGLKEMSSRLANVEFHLPTRAWCDVPLHGSHLLLSHGDTEVPTWHPDSGASRNANALDRINSTELYGRKYDVFAFGHWHAPRYQPRNPRVLWNGALLPPDGYHRGQGFVGEPCGQWLWEAVEGFPVGDVRFVEVGPAQDSDERLGRIIEPFRLPDA